FGRSGDRETAADRLGECLRLPHLGQQSRQVGARGQGAPARHDEPHSVHALPPSDPNALPTRPPELPCPLPRVRELVTESQRKAEICGYERSTAGTVACGE